MPDNIINVVIVEDHAVTLNGLVAGLALEPDINIVGTATTAAEGIAICSELLPAVILLDLHLPDSQGIDQLVAQYAALGSLVLVFTAESRRAFVEAVLALNVAGYLLKSAPADRVARAIRSAVSGLRPVLSQELITAQARLTPAEKDLLRLLARGLKYEQIAEQRNSAGATVKKQCERLLIKLSLTQREELIAWAVENGYGTVARK